jgi:hypothetical protein
VRDNYLCSHSGNSRSRLGVRCFPFALDFIISGGALENLAVPDAQPERILYTRWMERWIIYFSSQA